MADQQAPKKFNKIKYIDQFKRSNNYRPSEYEYEKIDEFPFELYAFNEILISPQYVHLYFDFDKITSIDEYDSVIVWLNSLICVFGNYTIGGYTNNEELSTKTGLKLIPGTDHFCSIHAIYYETMIQSIDLCMIMKHTEKRGFHYP